MSEEKCVECGSTDIKEDACVTCGLTGQKIEREMKERYDKNWKTCKHCGVKDGEVKGNYVMDGSCRKCRERIDREFDFNYSKENGGSIRRDDDIMCPYCGYVLEDDTYEYHNDKSFDCPECGKTSDLEVEYTTHFTTSKREDND